MNLDPQQEQALKKLEITELNAMQKAALTIIPQHKETIIHAQTGSGKTVAFLLPLLDQIDKDLHKVQLLILAPSRELALQIETVIRTMATGHKVNAFYGGQYMSRDRENLKQNPSILVGTPGRIMDHVNRETFDLDHIRAMVVDEFDKCMELGFDKQMKSIITALPTKKKTVLTSATTIKILPSYLDIRKMKVVDHRDEGRPRITLKKLLSEDKDKLAALSDHLKNLIGKKGIVFCNFRESAERISEHLDEHDIRHSLYHGGLEQKDRERALIKFRNFTHDLIVATDLAARGLDIPEIDFILHYHLPPREEEFTHRNGRTARMGGEGTIYLLLWEGEELKDYLPELEATTLTAGDSPRQLWTTLFISGGRKDKISKGDIAGLFMKQGELSKEDMGLIELKKDCAFVAVAAAQAHKLCNLVNNSRLKKKKVRIYEI